MKNVGTSETGTSRLSNASIDIESIVTSMKGKLDTLSLLSPNCCIYKVPERLRKINEDAYTPLRVSIGPLHHGKEGLKDMEEHKWRYLEDFLRHSQKSLEEFIEFVKRKEEKIRQCYAETINISIDEFVEIIFVDAAFIIEVLLRSSFPELITQSDRIFFKPFMIVDINCDMMLLENQLPFFILQDLFEMAKIRVDSDHNETPTFIKLTKNFLLDTGLAGMGFVEQTTEEIDSSEVQHFLDFLQRSIIPRETFQQSGKEFEFIPSVTELHEAGVKFKVSRSRRNFFDSKFTGSVLEIPHIIITDETELLLRNLIAYEECHCDKQYVIVYAVLMDSLINTSKDVELLVQSQVIENLLGDNDNVSNLFNKLFKEVTFDRKYFYYSELYYELNKFCKKRRHKWKANLRHYYCNTPWRILSIVVAVILLVLTFIQAIPSLTTVKK